MNICCIGSAVIDISASGMPEPENWQEKQRIEGIRLLPGGDAVNQSVILKKILLKNPLHADEPVSVRLISAAGNDTNGTALREMLKQRGVETEFFRIKEQSSTGTSLVLVNPSGERHTFSTGGAYGQLTLEDLPPLTPDVKAISISSLFQMPLLEQNGLAEYLRQANELHIPVFADLGSDKLHQGIRGIQHLLPFIDWFLPSVYDAWNMSENASPVLTDTSGNTAGIAALHSSESILSSEAEIQRRTESAAQFFRSHGARSVVIKCGKDGCCFLTPSESGWVPALPVTPVDTSGAGDCWVAVFITELLRQRPVREACETACALASRSTLFTGANSVEFD